MPAEQSITILLVEDDPGHARLIERNLRRAHITNDIVILVLTLELLVLRMRKRARMREN